MTVSPLDDHAPEATRTEERPDRKDGIFGLPGVGAPARKVREFYDGMEPQPEDSMGVKVGKQVVRYGTVAVAAGAAAVVVL